MMLLRQPRLRHNIPAVLILCDQCIVETLAVKTCHLHRIQKCALLKRSRSWKIDWKIMFYTSPEAEVRVPKSLAPNGERSWRWVELGLQIPYFLLSLHTSTKDCEMVRHLVLNQVGDVLDMAAQQSESFRILNLGLLSPGYMNGSEHYQLGQVREIWSAKGRGQPNVFVMADGQRLCFALGGGKSEEHEMELLLAL